MDGRTSGDPLAAARAALDNGEWQEALDLVETLPESADALEIRAPALYAIGRFEACVSAWEAVHALRVAQGDVADAARAASMVAMYLMIDTGLMAPVRGWMRRAERLLPVDELVPAHALVAMVRTYERFMCGDMDTALAAATTAIELGDRLDVGAAGVIGRVATARIMILRGDTDEGLELLDEVGTTLMSGAADPLTTGMMYCELICAAQGLAMHDRATQWTEVMERWRHEAAFGGLNGRCRVHRAELLRMSGPCDRAEAEALGACEDLRPWMRREFGWPLSELGNIRLRKGDLAGAEEAFVAAHELAWSAQPGLALLRLEQGNVESASAMIADAIVHPIDIPSKELPPFGTLRLAPLLDAQAEIAAAAGDVDLALRAAEELGTIARSFPSTSLRASAALAHARAALVDGNPPRAIDEANAAVVQWADVGAPFETARARMVLGEAHDRCGNDERAAMEWRAAHAAFAQFGAVRWAERASLLVDRRLVVSAPLATSTSVSATFRSDGESRTVVFRGRTVVLPDLTGFRYAARLLADPGRDFHALDLIAVEKGTLPAAIPGGRGQVASRSVRDAGLPLIDETARAAYRRRLAEVDEDIDEATSMNDIGRVALAQRDREYLIVELTRATGLGGRERTTGSTTERARTSVTRTIRYALSRLSRQHAELASHLQHCIRTGTYCRYDPDPTAPIVWDISR